MAKKARTAALTKQRHTAESIWKLVNSLPRAEKIKLFELANGDPGNEAVSELLQLLLEALRMFDGLWGSITKVWGSPENASSKRTEVDHENAEKLFGELRRKCERLQRTRGMMEENLETVVLYNQLIEKHGKERGAITKARMELLKQPCEQKKDYVIAYNESCRYHPSGKGEMEPVRQHLNQLRKRHSKRQQ
jgi:ribonuclease D